MVHAGGDSPLGFGVSLAYPVTDLVLPPLTVVVVAHARQASRSGLGLLAAGSYVTGSIVDAGWFGGFLLLAAAACTPPHPAQGRSTRRG